MERFGEKLRTLRKRRGMTLKELAHVLGLSAHSHLSELESGKSQPTSEIVVKLARLFNVSTDQLLLDELDIE
ncbi:MAG: helix-turn-helix transcriptional regulator [Caldilineaceae bacterium]